jgi:hypothetical protein
MQGRCNWQPVYSQTGGSGIALRQYAVVGSTPTNRRSSLSYKVVPQVPLSERVIPARRGDLADGALALLAGGWAEGFLWWATLRRLVYHRGAAVADRHWNCRRDIAPRVGPEIHAFPLPAGLPWGRARPRAVPGGSRPQAAPSSSAATPADTWRPTDRETGNCESQTPENVYG